MTTLEVATLGRPLHLGSLYSEHRGAFLPSSSLWNSSLVEETKVPIHSTPAPLHATLAKVATWRPSSEVQFSKDGDDSQLFHHMEIDARVSMTLLLGLLTVSGSGKYFKESKVNYY